MNFSTFTINCFAAVNACKPVPRLRQPENILGVKNIIETAKAWRSNTWLEMWYSRFSIIGTTFQAFSLGRTTIFTTDSENIKNLLATRFKDFDLGKRQINLITNIVCLQSLIRPNFTKIQVSELSNFEPHFQDLLAASPQPCPHTDLVEVDLQPLFFRLTLDSATELLLGRSFRSLLAAPGSTRLQFTEAFDYAQEHIHVHGLREQPDVRPIAWIYSIFAGSKNSKFDEACRTVHETTDKIITEYLGHLGEKASTKDKYVFLYELVKEIQDPPQLRYEILNVLLAGRDTTAALLSNIFFVLSRRPDVWARLQTEVKEAFEGRIPEYNILRNMRYIRNLLNECLRLYPVVPFNSRIATTNTILPRGGGSDGQSPVFVRAGQLVNYYVWAMHRDPKHFGPNAEVFDSDRWNDSSFRPGWAYIPFNGGPRICVGQQYALTEVAYIVVRLVQQFESVKCRDEQLNWIDSISLVTSSKRGTKVALKVRAK
ncbi:cytochrome P450 [Biscogniauxia marginata]|nr:cytochrome P450 [Biscogniauxia marginata]